jgi:hypothetical protein
MFAAFKPDLVSDSHPEHASCSLWGVFSAINEWTTVLPCNIFTVPSPRSRVRTGYYNGNVYFIDYNGSDHLLVCLDQKGTTTVIFSSLVHFPTLRTMSIMFALSNGYAFVRFLEIEKCAQVSLATGECVIHEQNRHGLWSFWNGYVVLERKGYVYYRDMETMETSKSVVTSTRLDKHTSCSAKSLVSLPVSPVKHLMFSSNGYCRVMFVRPNRLLVVSVGVGDQHGNANIITDSLRFALIDYDGNAFALYRSQSTVHRPVFQHCSLNGSTLSVILKIGDRLDVLIFTLDLSA